MGIQTKCPNCGGKAEIIRGLDAEYPDVALCVEPRPGSHCGGQTALPRWWSDVLDLCEWSGITLYMLDISVYSGVDGYMRVGNCPRRVQAVERGNQIVVASQICPSPAEGWDLIGGEWWITI